MKKLFFTTCVFYATISASLAQGTVVLQNGISTYLVSTNAVAIGGGVGVTTKTANQFKYALLIATNAVAIGGFPPSSNPLDSAWSDAVLTGVNFFITAGGISGQGGPAGAAAAGWGAPTNGSSYTDGTEKYFMIVGWSTNLGGTWSAVRDNMISGWSTGYGLGNAFFGKSDIGFGYAGGGPFSLPASSLFGVSSAMPGGLTSGFVLNAIDFLVFDQNIYITAQPKSQKALIGQPVTLSVMAYSQSPFSYRWFFNGTNIPGVTSSNLTFSSVQLTNSGNYFVVVSNFYISVTSAVVTVTAGFPPTITAQPLPQIVPAGTPVTLGVTVTGTPSIYYQWANSSGPIPNATNSSYSLNPAQTNDWSSYLVIATNLLGGVTSAVTPLVVYGPVTINTQPLNQIVPLNGTASFGVVANGFPGPVYQWTFNGTNLVGATSSSLSIPNVHLPNAGNYQVLINNGYSTSTSLVATLNIPPNITSPFSGASTFWGQGANLSVGAVGSGTLNYQWYLNGVAISGATENMLNFANIQFTNAGLYSVVVSSAYGSVTNAAYQVIVNTADVSLQFSPTLKISGPVGYSYIIQSSANLADTNAWVTLTNLTLAQPVELWVDTSVDASSPFSSKTFYKILPGQ